MPAAAGKWNLLAESLVSTVSITQERIPEIMFELLDYLINSINLLNSLLNLY